MSVCRWLHVLPRELKDAAGPGCACCLFWPPADAAGGRPPTGVSHGLWQRVNRRLPLLHYLTLAAKVFPPSSSSSSSFFFFLSFFFLLPIVLSSSSSYYSS